MATFNDYFRRLACNPMAAIIIQRRHFMQFEIILAFCFGLGDITPCVNEGSYVMIE